MGFFVQYAPDFWSRRKSYFAFLEHRKTSIEPCISNINQDAVEKKREIRQQRLEAIQAFFKTESFNPNLESHIALLKEQILLESLDSEAPTPDLSKLEHHSLPNREKDF